MIVLFTDFGADDIYVAQVKAALALHAPSTPIQDLLHRVPNFDAEAGAHLLAALQPSFPAGTVFFAVVDPGVGGSRAPVVVEADGKTYVGPDNGLLSVMASRASSTRVWRIVWKPPMQSVSFHGRDLFAPVAGRIAAGSLQKEHLEDAGALDVQFGSEDLAEVIYIDHYGNVLTGVRAGNLARTKLIQISGQKVAFARVFADVAAGTTFWYENSVGLIEIAVNRGSAAEALSAHVGDAVAFE